MFDKNHIIFTVTSFALTAILMLVCVKFVKKQEHKDKVLLWSALVTVALHYSIVYVDFFKYGSATIGDTMLLPVYPCNVAMWLLLAVGVWKQKSGIVFKVVAEITFYLGIVGGVVGLVANENYMNNPDMADWDIFKGLLSHSTLIFGCAYLVFGKYVRIRVDNVPSILIGLLFLVADGGLMIALFRAFNLDPPNCMFLLENPFPQLPWFNPWILGTFALILLSLFTVIYEQFAVKKEERWYIKIKNKLHERKEKEEQC